MIRRIARAAATLLVAASPFIQTAQPAQATGTGSALFAVARVWPLADTSSPDPLNPTDTPNLIGHNPTESAPDSDGSTGHVAVPGAMATTVTVMKNMIGSADGELVGVIYWNHNTNKFKWYGVVDAGSTAGLDINRAAPDMKGADGDLWSGASAPTFQKGDVWVGVA